MILSALFDKYAFPKREEPAETTLRQVEGRFRTSFPADYRAFASWYRGFENSMGVHYVQLWRIEALIEQNEGYDIQHYLPAVIGIGSNGGGELIAFDTSQPDAFRIILTPFLGLEDPIEIGMSFTDFLTRLDKGQPWFGNDNK